jgi:hypothetical protein
VLKSSPEEVERPGANGLVPSPLSPHELTGFPNYGKSDGSFHDRSNVVQITSSQPSVLAPVKPTVDRTPLFPHICKSART